MTLTALKYHGRLETRLEGGGSQGRSGRVALPRLKVVLTLLGMEERARRVRRADGRSMAIDIPRLLRETDGLN